MVLNCLIHSHMAKKNDATLFIMGLILGVIIAGVIVLTSAEDKAKIVKKIKDKFNDLFGETDKLLNSSRDVINHVSTKSKKIIKKDVKKIVKKVSKIRRDARSGVSTILSEIPQKISVTLPKGVETLNLTPVKTIKPKMVFKKSK